jgi:RTX calcium-binding nonapeptide repeat (4 copies)
VLPGAPQARGWCLKCALVVPFIIFSRNFMRNPMHLGLECLEDRNLLSANSVVLNAGVLSIAVNPNDSHTAVVSQTSTNAVQVQLDNKMYTFTDPVTQVNYQGGKHDDSFTNNTTIGGTLAFGNGNNIVLSKAGNETITAGNGNNLIQDQATNSQITVGNGNNSIYGGPGDTIKAGKGQDVIYDILGTNSIAVAAHEGRDYIFASASSTVTGAQANDRVALFFAANRQAGSGTLVLENGVLYFTANNAGDSFVLNQVGNKLVATYNLNDGNGFQTQVFKRSDVKLVANFGGAGNDTLINNTDIPDVQYGAGGNNLLIGGTGPLDLEKAGGASGNSTAIGRSPDYNDLNGSGSTNAVSVLIVNPDAKHNIVRTNNPADLIYGFATGVDTFVSPFKLHLGKL